MGRRLKRRLRSDSQRKTALSATLTPYLYAGYSLSNWLVRLAYVFREGLASTSCLALLAGISYTVSVPGPRPDSRDDRRSGWSVLGTLMLGLRFIQWWREHRDQLAMMAVDDGEGEGGEDADLLPPPPPPRGRAPAAPSSTAPRTIARGACPVCGSSSLRRPVALPTGYVCCAHCLQACPQYTEHGQCPVTGAPLGDASLIRPLYIV